MLNFLFGKRNLQSPVNLSYSNYDPSKFYFTGNDYSRYKTCKEVLDESNYKLGLTRPGEKNTPPRENGTVNITVLPQEYKVSIETINNMLEEAQKNNIVDINKTYSKIQFTDTDILLFLSEEPSVSVGDSSVSVGEIIKFWREQTKF